MTMGSEPEESPEEAELRERFRFLRERVYAVSRAFIDRVLGGIDEQLATPGESFAIPYLIEMVNLASSIVGADDDEEAGGEDDAPKKPPKE